MASTGPSLRITRKDFQDAEEVFAKFASMKEPAIYVGVPEDTAERKHSEEITNAQLVFIHTNGSPRHNIPPRPIIEPALNAPETKKAIERGFKQLALDTLDGKKSAVLRRMKLLGVLGQKAARGWFVDPRNAWIPDKPATIKRKLAKMRGKKGKAARAAYAAGRDTFEWKGSQINVNITLVDTAQMRKSITWVIRPEEGVLITGEKAHPDSKFTHGAEVDENADGFPSMDLRSLRDIAGNKNIGGDSESAFVDEIKKTVLNTVKQSD